LQKLFGILFSLNRDMPEHDKWVLACLEGAWAKLLGNKLATVCRPAAVKGSELVVVILDRNWEEALQSVKPEIQEKLRVATAGEIKRISFSGQ
jgi:hypothetical protein